MAGSKVTSYAICWSFVMIIAIGFSEAQVDCTGLPDGSYGHGCASYTSCVGGRGTIVDCKHEYAFDFRIGECAPWTTVPPPCGSIDNNCTGYADARYAIMPDCMYYYTCQGGVFFGANPCNNPPDKGDLRFDAALEQCNWYYDTAPPCGTFIGTTEPPQTTDQMDIDNEQDID